MKRKELIRIIMQMGCVRIRHGGKHDWYQNPTTKIAQPIPRHNEINEGLSKHILKMLKTETHQCIQKNNVTKVVLFGSFSRASQTKRSDFDLMIITKTDKRFFERYDQFDAETQGA